MCFRINLTKPDSVRQSVTFRKLRDICILEFIKDLTQIFNDIDRPLNELVHAYTTGIEAVVDQHAPVQRKSITLRPNAQWYSDELRHAKHARRQAKKVWRRTKLTVQRQLFREQCNAVNKLMISAKKHYFLQKSGTAAKIRNNKLTSHLMGNTGNLTNP